MFTGIAPLVVLISIGQGLSLQSFRVADAQTKSSMILEAGRSLTTIETDDIDPEAILLVLATGLTDSDARVRRSAAGVLSQIIMYVRAGLAERVPAIDPRGRADLREALFNRVTDADFWMRGAAARALPFVAGYEDPAVWTALLRGFRVEPEYSVRAAIASELKRAVAMPQTRELTLAALRDEDRLVRGFGALAAAKLRPAAGLKAIVDELRRGDLQTRAAFVRGLEGYGEDAKPHLDLLRTIHDAEERSDVRVVIARAIRTIEQSKWLPAGQVRPIGL